MAFASSWTPVAAPTGRSPFLGGRAAAVSTRPSAGPSMRNAISNDTYAPKVALPTITPSSVPSRVGNPSPVRPIRANNLLNKFRVTAVGRAKALQQYADRAIDDMAVSDPAEAYMAAGVNVLYGDPKANAGASTPSFGETLTKGKEEKLRKAELCATYLSRNRTTAEKYNDFYEVRRQALNLVDGSSYAEGLVTRYPAFARKVVDRAEAEREASLRYVAPTSVEEAYMTAAADAAMKRRRSPRTPPAFGGIDGVNAVAAEYLSKNAAPLDWTQGLYDANKVASVQLGHGCDYEEGLYKKFKSVAAVMRPTPRY